MKKNEAESNYLISYIANAPEDFLQFILEMRIIECEIMEILSPPTQVL